MLRSLAGLIGVANTCWSQDAVLGVHEVTSRLRDCSRLVVADHTRPTTGGAAQAMPCASEGYWGKMSALSSLVGSSFRPFASPREELFAAPWIKRSLRFPKARSGILLVHCGQ